MNSSTPGEEVVRRAQAQEAQAAQAQALNGGGSVGAAGPHLHVVMFSGGIGSWAAASRVRDRHQEGRIVALFADTRMEDEDLYRFLPEAAASVGAELVIVADGRTPWGVFRERRFLGNTRVDLCSRILKREALDAWCRDNLSPARATLYVGIDWTEEHRFQRVRERLAPWRVEAPMCEPPYISKADMRDALAVRGIAPPRLYALGFTHNNCGGFCIKGGHAHFANLLRTMPERYRYHEGQEESLRAELGDVAILRDRAGGSVRPLTLRELRERIEGGGQYDQFDLGACGCFAGQEQQP